jgi:hypothetical protein
MPQSLQAFRLCFYVIDNCSRTLLSRDRSIFLLLLAIAEWMIAGFIIGYLLTQLLIVNPGLLPVKVGLFAAVIAGGSASIIKAAFIRTNANIVMLIPLLVLLSICGFQKLLF